MRSARRKREDLIPPRVRDVEGDDATAQIAVEDRSVSSQRVDAGVVDPRRCGDGGSASAPARPRSSHCRCMRNDSVFTPRSVSQASNGPSTAPVSFVSSSISSTRSRVVAMTPPVASPCPPRYLVVEWTTVSTPKRAGLTRSGVAKVLSTTVRTRCWLRDLDQRRDVGDADERVGDRLEEEHARSSPRPGLARTSSRSRTSTNVVFTPRVPKTLPSRAWVAP